MGISIKSCVTVSPTHLDMLFSPYRLLIKGDFVSAKPNDGQLNDNDPIVSMGAFERAMGYPVEPEWPALVDTEHMNSHYAKVNAGAWTLLRNDDPLNRRRVYLECLLSDASRLMEELGEKGFDVNRLSHQALLYGVGPHTECLPGNIKPSLLDCIPQRFSCILTAPSGPLYQWLCQPSDWLYIAVDLAEYARLSPQK